ncbi:MAG: sigma 54-interacting transcriptional regulator [Bacillota bacterium]
MSFIKKRIVFISYPRLTKVISQLVPSYLKEVLVYEGHLNEVLDITRKLIFENTVDVIISGGGNGQHIKNHIKEIPVIVFKITVADLLEGIKNLNKQVSKIGILGYKDAIPDLMAFREHISFDFTQDWFISTKQMKNKFQKMVDEGCDGFIGTGLVCDYATDFGFPAYMVYSKENVEETFKEAFKYQWALNFNREREERTNAILNYSKKAFLFINTDRKIQTANTLAEKILGISRNKLVGSFLDEIVDATEFNSVMCGEEEVSESVIKLKGKELAVTYKAIKIDNHLSEVIAILDDSCSTCIQTDKNRKESIHSGFTASYSFRNIIGHSKAIQDVIESAQGYAVSNYTILILGETGTGKELFAQSIHNHSSRNNRPFVSVNCSALPNSLLESELFGYESGTFTGGRKEGKPGLIEQANTGTLFLDEIGDMSPEGQVMLLRVLQEKKLRRLGGNKIISVDVRVVAATNQPLENLVERGLFRSDLYYRLNVLNLDLPPLRSRRGDIPDLIDHFIKEHGLSMDTKNKDIIKRLLLQADYQWPGNIRELENLFLKITCNPFSEPEEIKLLIEKLLFFGNYKGEASRSNACLENEEYKILEVLEQTQWNRTKAAKTLGMSRTTLWRKICNLSK